MTVSPVAARILIALVIVNAAAGVTALVVSSDKQIGSFEGHIFLTTLAVSLAAFSALPCALAWERQTLRPYEAFSLIAAAAVIFTLFFLVALIWTDDPSDTLERTAASLVFVSVAAALINLLSLAPLKPSYTWVRLNAYALAALLCAEAIVLIWSDDPGDNGFRLLIGTGILLTAASVMIPVLQRLDAEAHHGDGLDVNYCPACGHTLGDEARSACPACGARFSVRFE